jgi:hypothetical protein
MRIFLMVMLMLCMGCGAGKTIKVGKDLKQTGPPGGELIKNISEVQECWGSDVPPPLIKQYNSGANMIVCDGKEYPICYDGTYISIPEKLDPTVGGGMSVFRHMVGHHVMLKTKGIPDKGHEDAHWGTCVRKGITSEYITP